MHEKIHITNNQRQDKNKYPWASLSPNVKVAILPHSAPSHSYNCSKSFIVMLTFLSFTYPAEQPTASEKSCTIKIPGLRSCNNTHRMPVDQTPPKVSYKLLIKREPHTGITPEAR